MFFFVGLKARRSVSQNGEKSCTGKGWRVLAQPARISIKSLNKVQGNGESEPKSIKWKWKIQEKKKIQLYQSDDVNHTFIKLNFGKVPTILQGEPVAGSTKQKPEMLAPNSFLYRDRLVVLEQIQKYSIMMLRTKKKSLLNVPLMATKQQVAKSHIKTI